MTWSPEEKRPFFLQRETQMVRRVAGGVNGAQGPAGAARRVAVAHLAVRDEIEIAAFLDRDSAVGAVGAVAPSGRAGQRPEPLRRRRMVEMGMRDNDMAHRFAVERRHDCLDMRLVRRPRVDDRDLALADDVGPRAVEGEGARVAGDDAAHQRRHAVGDAVFEFERLVEGNFQGGTANEASGDKGRDIGVRFVRGDGEHTHDAVLPRVRAFRAIIAPSFRPANRARIAQAPSFAASSWKSPATTSQSESGSRSSV